MSRIRNRRVLLGVASATALLIAAAPALAGAFGIREQSVVGGGQAFAGAASGAAGLGSLFWNPATVTMNPGWQSEVNGTYIDPSARIRTTAPTPTLGLGQSGDIGISALVPATFTSYQINDIVWLGLAGTSPFGLVTKPNPVWAGETYSRSSRVFSLNFNPIVGIKVTDWFSVGAGPVIQYFKTRLTSALAPTRTAPSGILEGDDVGVGATVGATITPFAGTTIGVGYRSSIHQEIDGTFRAVVPAGPGAGTPFVSRARVNLNLPDQVTAGLSQVVTRDLRVNLGFEFTNWSRLKLPVVTAFASGAPLTTVPLGYKDGYYYALGGEYDFNTKLTVRAGVAYETSPIDQSNRGTRLPDTDRVHANVGATYHYSDTLDISAYYSHIFTVGNKQLRIVPGNIVYNGLPFFGDVKADVNLVGLSAKFRLDDPRVAQPAAIIRKY